MKFCCKTGFIKNEDGFTLIETLVATIILILIVTLLSGIMGNMLTNKKYFKRNAAFFIARQEMDKTLNQKIITDTMYTIEKPFFMVQRKIKPYNKAYSVDITILMDTLNTKIVELNGIFYK